MTGKEAFELVTEWIGVKKDHLRLTCGYREIYPNEQIQNW